MRAFGYAIIVLIGSCLSAVGQNQPPTIQAGGFLVISQDELFSRTLAGKTILQDVEAATQALVAENAEIESELIVEEKGLTEQRSEISAEDFRILADAFDEKVQKIRKRQEEKSDAIGAQLDTARRAYFQDIIPILAEILRELRAVAILDKRSVLLSVNVIDITDRAIERIDIRLGEGRGLNFEQ